MLVWNYKCSRKYGVGDMKISRSFLFGLIFLFVFFFISSAYGKRLLGNDACISAASIHFELFQFDRKLLTEKCYCAHQIIDKKFSRKSIDWIKSGRESAQLALIECAEEDIVNFYREQVFRSGLDAMKRDGIASDPSTIEKLQSLSECVGNGSYEHVMRAVMADTESQKMFDKLAYLHMYKNCISGSNGSN